MNDFYPIYKSKLKPWIKWWILKRLNGGESTLKVITISSGTLTKVDKTKPLSVKEYYGNTVQEGTPTPETPIEVQTISGDNNIVVSNKNLFDNNFANYILTGGNYGYKQVTEEDEPLILSVKDKDTSISLSGVYFGFSGTGINASQGVSWIINNGTVQTTATNILSDNRYLKYISFYPKNETTFNKIISRYDIQIEKGITATSYIAHQGNSYRVDLGGKNIFNIEQAITRMENSGGSLINGWGTYEDGILTMNRSMGYHGVCYFAGQKFNLKANKTYTLSATVYLTGTNTTSNVILGFEGATNPNVTITKETWTKVSRTVSFTEDKENVRVFIQPSNTGNVLQMKEVMLCEGTDTNYSPYTDNPIELCKIGDYQDKLYYDSGKWYLHKEVGKVVLNGSETWKRSSVSATNSSAFWNQYVNLNIPVGKYGQKYCDKFEYQEKNWEQSTPNHLAENTNYTSDLSILFNVDSTIATTVSGWTTWLSNNNTTVYYVLANSTQTEITDETLISQLEALGNVTVNSSTVIISNDSEIPFEMKIEYYGR